MIALGRCAASVAGLLVGLAACRSATSGGGDRPGSPDAIAVEVAPPTAILGVGQSRTFTARVPGTTDTAVAWSVVGTACGGITSGGVYTAPGTVPTETCKVRATSQADTGKYGEAIVAVVSTGGSISPQVTPSRVSGVAPLSVFFDATGTTGLADGSYLDATFAWNFDSTDVDPAAKHRRASGFVAAHVFEQPGTYTVHLDVLDRTGAWAGVDITITAQAFTGQTYYVAANGMDSNDGKSMGSPVLTVQHALGDLAKPNTRVLFRRGDTFNTPNVTSSGAGPVIVASYEDPAQRSDQAPIIHGTEVDAWGNVIAIGTDWRIMDLHVNSGGYCDNNARALCGGRFYPGGVGFEGNNSLIYRVLEETLGITSVTAYGQYNTVADCEFHDSQDAGYSDGDEANHGNALIGNWVHDMREGDWEHVFRLQGGQRFFIAENHFGPKTVANWDALTIRGNSHDVVIYGNTLEDWVTSVEPQNRDQNDERQHHVILDSNLFIGRQNNGQALVIDARDVTVRNNVFYNYDLIGSLENDTVVGPAQRISIYNNTAIGSAAGFGFFNVPSPCSDIRVENNVFLRTGNGGGNFLSGGSLAGVSDHNLLYGSGWTVTGTELFDARTLSAWRTATGQDANSLIQDPAFLSLDPNSTSFATPSAASPVVGKGVPLGAALDFHGNPRGAAIDIGAVQH
jgi:hypothetical protein